LRGLLCAAAALRGLRCFPKHGAMFFLSALKTVRRTNIFLDEGLERVSAQQKKLVRATQ
jgi:hypothetical protein